MKTGLRHDQNVKGTAAWGSLSFLFMKKFLTFILFLVLLIISEYFLVNELFSTKRLPILLISLLSSIIFLVATYRFFKKNFLPVK